MQVGLVDAEDSSDPDTQFDKLDEVWNEGERSFTSKAPVLHSWFRCNILEVVRSSMLREKRIIAGLGYSPDPFYTNDVESKNRVLKYQTNYRQQELLQFVESMKELFVEQRAEIEKAVAGLGEYQLAAAYRDMAVDTKHWFMKSEPQRKWAVARFMNARLAQLPHQETAEDSTSDTGCSHLMHMKWTLFLLQEAVKWQLDSYKMKVCQILYAFYFTSTAYTDCNVEQGPEVSR